MERNLERETPPDDDDDDQQKYILSLSILNFLKVSSCSPIMQQYMKNQGKILNRIINYEDIHSSERVKRIPLDIENTTMGRYMQPMIDTISGNDSIEPYCDVALRVLIRIGDILMFRHRSDFCIIEEKDDVAQKLTSM